MKKQARPIERPCRACRGTGLSPAKQPKRPGVRVYPPRCAECLGKGKISDIMGDVAKGIKSFKKGMAEDDKPADKSEPVKTLEASTPPKTETERRAESVRS